MKKRISITKVLAFCMILIITFVLTQLSNATTPAAPGSTGDPLITKSYVDGKVKSLNTKIANLQHALDSTEASLASAQTSIKTMKTQIATLLAKNGESAEYLTVKKGKTILLKEGGMVVVFSGVANVIGKLTDLTDGKALNTNQIVALRHLIASPMADTRGIKAKADITVLLSGSYTIK